MFFIDDEQTALEQSKQQCGNEKEIDSDRDMIRCAGRSPAWRCFQQNIKLQRLCPIWVSILAPFRSLVSFFFCRCFPSEMEHIKSYVNDFGINSIFFAYEMDAFEISSGGSTHRCISAFRTFLLHCDGTTMAVLYSNNQQSEKAETATPANFFRLWFVRFILRVSKSFSTCFTTRETLFGTNRNNLSRRSCNCASQMYVYLRVGSFLRVFLFSSLLGYTVSMQTVLWNPVSIYSLFLWMRVMVGFFSRSRITHIITVSPDFSYISFSCEQIVMSFTVTMDTQRSTWFLCISQPEKYKPTN